MLPGGPPHDPMLCQNCSSNPATLRVIDVQYPTKEEGAKGPATFTTDERHLCDACAKQADLPHVGVHKQTVTEIWKVLKAKAQKGRKESAVSCPECGMTLLEFRQRGRLGCPKDYEVFAPHLRDLFERIHGATKHVGRSPGLDPDDLQRMRRRSKLQQALEVAIRDEEYEEAAQLRDALKTLDGPHESV